MPAQTDGHFRFGKIHGCVARTEYQNFGKICGSGSKYADQKLPKIDQNPGLSQAWNLLKPTLNDLKPTRYDQIILVVVSVSLQHCSLGPWIQWYTKLRVTEFERTDFFEAMGLRLAVLIPSSNFSASYLRVLGGECFGTHPEPKAFLGAGPYLLFLWSVLRV